MMFRSPLQTGFQDITALFVQQRAIASSNAHLNPLLKAAQ